ncbi:hypothetical protein BLNAU_1934 [Blattamonas nauphoetae]|uniref:Uncharacterized protein n=1 Tax=Blattamonas nauphoetae TaxID=2049346 RepID=A0ABQ9YGM4_9EUKA|nr:hypothetical protein BLNAU_1934 [Blattamonas nauphoetae]
MVEQQLARKEETFQAREVLENWAVGPDNGGPERDGDEYKVTVMEKENPLSGATSFKESEKSTPDLHTCDLMYIDLSGTQFIKGGAVRIVAVMKAKRSGWVSWCDEMYDEREFMIAVSEEFRSDLRGECTDVGCEILRECGGLDRPPQHVVVGVCDECEDNVNDQFSLPRKERMLYVARNIPSLPVEFRELKRREES